MAIRPIEYHDCLRPAHRTVLDACRRIDCREFGRPQVGEVSEEKCWNHALRFTMSFICTGVVTHFPLVSFRTVPSCRPRERSAR